jgi:hypothetical protein
MSALSVYSRSALQAERSKVNPIPHEKLNMTFCHNEGASLGCGDVGILHNIAMLLKGKVIVEKDKIAIDRFHIIVRTMRRATHWDWVKPEHINLILDIFDRIHEDIDLFVELFKDGQQHYLEGMEKAVEEGIMSEGDYLDCVNGLKKPYEFITGDDFAEWVKGRSDFYKTLNGALPKIKIIQVPQFNQHDGKTFIITA